MIPFHRLLISTAIVFCFVFAIWCGFNYRETRSGGTLAVAIVFAAAGAALGYYLRHLNRFLGR